MKLVYSAKDTMEAHLLAGALKSRGIHAEVRGGHLENLRGELPFDVSTNAAVWVPEEVFEVARKIVESFNSKK